MRKMMWALAGSMMALALVSGCSSSKKATPPPATDRAPSEKPLLIQHGWDVAPTSTMAKNAAAIDKLAFDGMTILPKQNPCELKAVLAADAETDLAAMPKLTKVTHNFVLCRLTEDGVNGASPYDIGNDATWSIVAANLATYATAAKKSGMFDGILIDTEYYGTGPNPWDHDTIPIPLEYGPARPWTLTNEARLKAMARGKQIADAMKAAWPEIVMFSLRGAELSDPATFKSNNMMGNQVSWANELAGPFFMGMVESVKGTKATIVSGGESYRQRTLADFQKAYAWVKTGLPDSNGPMVPSGNVTAADYKATVSVANQVFDMNVETRVGNTFTAFTPAELTQLLSFASQATDRYYWIYTEGHDWKGNGHPKTPVTDEYKAAIAASKA
jgi:hypothetical protein